MPEILNAVDQYQLQCVSLADAPGSLLSNWQAYRRQIGSESWEHDPEWLQGYFEGQTDNLRLYSLYESGSLAGTLLFFFVPNRLYPFEIHTRKWGWNYFPHWLCARTVDSNFWEVRRLARRNVLTLHQTPLVQLFRPWSNFCLRKEVNGS
jgi:hypothetical protein